ncbi:hypothetical protein LOTGIDRAFT_204705 [Lottia gigantea]|uniref:Uncharacterized protein n=1 Tax=Lottia gigantea TaxID=225164 RepID=V4B7P2_LOTGI|nr:hypothetical protein LOTGIDRAFT_204705 [Lottia gigantea]ESO84649.1 hypothetical protein LOTGIDRAFT_204705 [Lottia gigantea]
MDTTIRGIQGSAMSVPPPSYIKEVPSFTPHEHFEERRKSSSKSTQSEATNRSPDLSLKKDLKEALGREKELKNRIEELLKIIEELKKEIRLKEENISSLENDLIKKEADFKNQLSVELGQHENTKQKLLDSSELVEKLRLEITSLKMESDRKFEKLKKEHEEKLAAINIQKNQEIKARDEKLAKIKQHMADALQGNSWERQQQLEELTKELAKIQDEADMLRSKIKSLSKPKQASCSHCEETNNKLKKALHALKEKDQAIKDLESLVVKFETQLSQQDQLLKMFAEDKALKYDGKFQK